MIVHDYDLQNGIYAFTERNLRTSLHAHPALELISTEEGEFSFFSPDGKLGRAEAILIPANYPHALDATGVICRIKVAEPEFIFATKLTGFFGHENWRSGITRLAVRQAELLRTEFFQSIISADAFEQEKPDVRVLQCIAHLEKHAHERKVTLAELGAIVHLSESRISHLFKGKMGVTLQRYQSWCRLKKTVATFLATKVDLQSAAWDNGFYDAAHFNRTFREMMGLNPSEVYNSGIVQTGEA